MTDGELQALREMDILHLAYEYRQAGRFPFNADQLALSDAIFAELSRRQDELLRFRELEAAKMSAELPPPATDVLINGRVAQKGEFVHTAHVDNEGVSLRIDNSADLAFWLEIFVPKNTLVRWLKDVVEAEHDVR